MPTADPAAIATQTPSASPPRALALDALRGFAILTMVLSGIVPHGGKLPAWMYHAQTPPPDHKFNAAVPGITDELAGVIHSQLAAQTVRPAVNVTTGEVIDENGTRRPQ